MRGWLRNFISILLVVSMMVGLFPVGAVAKDKTIEIIQNEDGIYAEYYDAEYYDVKALENLELFLDETSIGAIDADGINSLFSPKSEEDADDSLEDLDEGDISDDSDAYPENEEEPDIGEKANDDELDSISAMDGETNDVEEDVQEEDAEVNGAIDSSEDTVDPENEKGGKGKGKKKSEAEEESEDLVSEFVLTYIDDINEIGTKTLFDLIQDFEATIEYDYIYDSVLADSDLLVAKHKITIYLHALLQSSCLDEDQEILIETVLDNFEYANQLVCQNTSAILGYSVLYANNNSAEAQLKNAVKEYNKAIGFSDNGQIIPKMKAYANCYKHLIMGLDKTNIVLNAALFDDDTDTDGDYLPDGIEFLNRMNPYNADTDGDGLDDLSEIWTYEECDPTLVDTDKDGISDFMKTWTGMD